nr:MAG TPA: hypothetical protein [Caudoviricetes sp.]
MRTSASRFAERALYSAIYRNFFNNSGSTLTVNCGRVDGILKPPCAVILTTRLYH